MRQIFLSSVGWYHYLLDHRNMLIYRDNYIYMYCLFIYLAGILLSVIKVFEINTIP